MLSVKGVLSLLAAIVSILLGVSVYLLDRPTETVYLFNLFSVDANPPWSVFGILGQWLPTYLHIYAFILLTALVWGIKRKTILLSGLVWVLIEVLFELGQSPMVAPVVTAWIPVWFSEIPVLDNLDAYFTKGTFDPLDLVAALAGCLSAWFTVELIHSKEVTHENGEMV